METTDFCPYELSKKLKACGFDEPCEHYWSKAYKNSDRMAIRQASADDYNNDDWDVPHCSAPHIYHAQKWLREKKGIAINVIAHDGGAYDYDIVFLPNAVDCDYPIDRATFSRTYEEALSEGISAALELIKKGE